MTELLPYLIPAVAIALLLFVIDRDAASAAHNAFRSKCQLRRHRREIRDLRRAARWKFSRRGL